MLVGLTLALATSVAWAFGNVFVQRSSRAVGEARSLFWSMVIGGLLSAAMIPLFDRPTAPIDAPAVAWLLGAGVSSLVAYGGMFVAFARGDLSLTVPFISCWSLVAGAIGLAVFGERPRSMQLVGAAVVFFGVMLVAIGTGRARSEGQRRTSRDGPRRAKPAAPQAIDGGTLTGSRTSRDGPRRAKPAAPQAIDGGTLTGSRTSRDGPRRAKPAAPHAQWTLVVALLAGIGFGVMFSGLSQAAPAFGAFGAAASVYALTVLLGLPVAALARLSLRWPPPGARAVVLGTALFETAGFVLLTAAGLVAPVSLVAPVASLAAVFTIAYAFLFLRERPGPVALAGSLLASAGVVLLAAARG